MKVAIVGVCASGKSTLAKALQQFGIDAVDVAQEHSLVPTMWEKITRPDVLIYLEASQETVRARWPYKGNVDFVAEQVRRLAHARAHADLIINVDALTPQQTLAKVLRQLEIVGAQKFDSSS
jgi:deoxyadenosine/deoxycytidine kinase